jgi:hypothetical protein
LPFSIIELTRHKVVVFYTVEIREGKEGVVGCILIPKYLNMGRKIP